MNLRDKAVSDQSFARVFWGLHERKEVSFVKRFLRGDTDVIELGASLGVVSLHIARALKPGRRLVCVEANPHLVETARRNLSANFPDRDIKVVNQAIDYRGGGVSYLRIDRNNLGSALTDHSDSGTSSVQTTTLAQLQRQFGIGEFALVSDIEGAELGLFREDGAALKRCRQIIIELHATRDNDRSYSVQDLVEMIQSLDFRPMQRVQNLYLFER